METFSDLDRMFGYTYTKSAKITTPAGLTLETSFDREYEDTDDDGVPETITSLVTVNNRTSQAVHDVRNSTRTATTPEGRTATSVYDPLTLLTLRSEVPGLYPTEYSWRDDGKVESVTTGNRTTSYTYDALGNLETVTDPMQKVTRFTDYDDLGRLLRTERADTSTVRFDYDENGNMTLLVTPRPADNSFTHNKVNNRSSYLTHLGSTTSYTYNPERQLTEVTLPSTKKIINTYVDSRLTETTTEEWTNVYEYACGDLLDSVTRGTEVLSYDYDGSLVTAISQTGTLNQDLGFTYNNDFNLTSFIYAGVTESYTYDNDGLLISAGDFTVTRNTANGLPESVFDGMFTLNRSFNGYGEIDNVATTVSGSAVFSYDLVRNNSGRITTKTETVDDGTASESVYTYDDLGRLLTVTKDSALTEEYRYDDNGNRTYQTNTALDITGRSFSYSTEDHIMDTGGIIYEFDLDDNLAAKTEGAETTEYAYSSTGELMSVTLPDGTAITYIHDPNGRRIAKLVDGTIVEKYLWSGLTTLLAVYDGSDNLVQRFEYADGRMPVAMTAGGGTYYLAYDQVGSLRLVTDASGAVVKRIDYDTFGNILSDSNPSFTIPFGFAGGLHDRDTGLVRFGFRDYMPEIGRWTAKDPILFDAGDTNLYGYVGNDPVNFIDLYGLLLEDVDNARSYIQRNYPEYYNANSEIKFHDKEYGETTLDGTIYLPQKCRDEVLTDREREELVGRLAHEYQHANDLEKLNSIERIIYLNDMYHVQNGSDPNKGIWKGRHSQIYRNSAKVQYSYR